MSLYERRKVLILAAGPVALAACGFSPVYAPGGAAARARGKLRINLVDGPENFTLREQLASRLGAPDAPTHVLDVTFRIESEGLAITQGADITRVNLTGTVEYTIRPISGDQTLFEDTVRRFASYNTTSSPYATRVAERDARTRLAVVLADMIAGRVAATADRWLQ